MKQEIFSERETILSPERRKERILELYKAGLDKTENTVGYHGTSVEALEFLIKNGNLAGATTLKDSQRRELHFFPVNGMEEMIPGLEEFGIDQAIKEVESYASMNAVQHFLIKSIGEKLDDKKMVEDYHNYGPINNKSSEIENYLLDRGLSDSQKQKLTRESLKLKGVIISLNRKILQGNVELGSDVFKNSALVNIKGGVTLDMINGIHTEGEREKDFFRKLLEK